MRPVIRFHKFSLSNCLLLVRTTAMFEAANAQIIKTVSAMKSSQRIFEMSIGESVSTLQTVQRL